MVLSSWLGLNRDSRVRQIQGQQVYKQILKVVCREGPSNIPNPVIVVAEGGQGEQTARNGQEHVFPKLCFPVPLS